MKTGCIDENRVLAFVDGTISDADRAGIEEHLAGCGDCMELHDGAPPAQTAW